MNMSDSVGIAVEMIPTIPGGLMALSWGVTAVPVPSGGAGGLVALPWGEAELPAQVVTIKI